MSEPKFQEGETVFAHIGEPGMTEMRVVLRLEMRDRLGIYYLLEPLDPDFRDLYVRDEYTISKTPTAPAFNGLTSNDIRKGYSATHIAPGGVNCSVADISDMLGDDDDEEDVDSE